MSWRERGRWDLLQNSKYYHYIRVCRVIKYIIIASARAIINDTMKLSTYSVSTIDTRYAN